MRFWAVAVPAQGGDLVEVGLAGLDDERALVDVGLQDGHGAVEEEVGVVVVRRAGEQLDVERTGDARILAIGVKDAQAGEQRGAPAARRP